MAAIEGMIEITTEITRTSIETSRGTPNPATATTTLIATISLDERSALTPDIPKRSLPPTRRKVDILF